MNLPYYRFSQGRREPSAATIFYEARAGAGHFGAQEEAQNRVGTRIPGDPQVASPLFSSDCRWQLAKIAVLEELSEIAVADKLQIAVEIA